MQIVGIVAASVGNVYLCGNTAGSFTMGSKTISTSGGYDIFTVGGPLSVPWQATSALRTAVTTVCAFSYLTGQAGL